MVLAIDLGTKTGMCLYEGGVVYLRLLDMSKLTQKERFGLFYEKLLELIETKNLSKVVTEDVCFVKGSIAAKLWYGFFGILAALCTHSGIELVQIHPLTLKKFLTGNGKASKDDMIKATRHFCLDIPEDQDDLADAFAMMLWEKSNEADKTVEG
jgi:Holliday junction resolvasome RuvABC endonuclease subunit